MGFGYITPVIVNWKLDKFIEIIDKFENALAEKTHHKIYVGKDYQTILLHIAGKSILTAREVLTLCAHGYPDGALSLGRNLYEQMMIVLFFEAHKNDYDFHEYVDDFFLSYEVQRNKCLRDIEKYILQENHEELIREYEILKRKTISKIGGNYWWARCDSFSALVSSVIKMQTDERVMHFLGIQYARYKRACISLHSSCMGNSNRIGNHTGFSVVDTSPTIYGHSTPLVYAAISLISIVGVICACFQLDAPQYLTPLNELAVYYQTKEKDDVPNIK